MNFTKPVSMIRPISFARRDDDSLICAWHFRLTAVESCTGFVPVPTADGGLIDMLAEPSLLLRLGACAPRRTRAGNVFRYAEPQNPPIGLKGIFKPGEVQQTRTPAGPGRLKINWEIQLAVSKGEGHGHCFARRVLAPKQLAYPVPIDNASDHRWVNLVQDKECPGHGWKESQFPAGFLFKHSGSVVLNDHNLWYREGPLEYPDCLFDE